MQISLMSSRSLYQLILSSKQSSKELQRALEAVVQRAISQPALFEFLLHRVNWFDQPLNAYLHHLRKTIRIYRGQGKQPTQVAYNLLAENISIPQHAPQTLICLKQLLKDQKHSNIALQCLKNNYPHKVCPLQMHQNYMKCLLDLYLNFPIHRVSFLQIIVQSLVSFDTELLFGDEFLNCQFPSDQEVMNLRSKATSSELANKLDVLLHQLLEFVLGLGQTLQFEEIFLVFQMKVLPIKNTKVVQYLLYALAENTKCRTNKLVTLLLADILENAKSQRIVQQTHFYLVSYLCRSTQISINRIQKVVHLLILNLVDSLKQLSSPQQHTPLTQLYLQNQSYLITLQSILMICTHHSILRVKMKQELQELLQKSKTKLQFTYFIPQQLLLKWQQQVPVLSKNAKKQNHVIFSHKFLPLLLQMSGELIDPIFGWNVQTRGQIDQLRKMIKRQQCASHSICSNEQTA